MAYAPPMPVCKGTKSMVNIAAATLVQAGPGRIARVSVVTAGAAAGAVNDCNGDTIAVDPKNKIATIPNAVGIYELDWPVDVGIYVTPGSGQVLAVLYA